MYVCMYVLDASTYIKCYDKKIHKTPVNQISCVYIEINIKQKRNYNKRGVHEYNIILCSGTMVSLIDVKPTS